MKAVALPPSWHSRILILLAFVAAVSVAACSEKLEAGAACPVLCPVQGVELKDTVVEAVAMDSTLPVTPVIGEETSMLLAARGDTLDTRIIFRFDTIIQTYQHPSAPADTIITKVDSATLRIVLDTTTRPNVPGLPTVPVTLELYDVDYSASDTVAADLIPLFDSSRLLGSKTFAPESLSKDTLFIPVSNSAVLDKITNGTHLRLGMRLVSSASAQLRVLSKASVGALLRFKPAADTAITVSLISKTPADSTLATLREHLSDYVIVAKGIAPRPPLTIAAGGYPANRTYMRFDLPSKIVDSATIVRASVLLTQYPMRASPSARDSVAVYAMPVTAGAIVTDVGRLIRLVTINTAGAPDSLRLIPADSGARRLEMVNIVRVWQRTKPEQTQRSILLVIGAESLNPAEVVFFSSAAGATLRPRLELTYVPRVNLGLP